jgi:23S rRNA (cytidine1920-2'-O)/16S rRNA (cytidine1409-2'-O)-methyltransferase
MKKKPVWQVLVDRGYFPDRKTAESWVLAGSVICNDTRIDKPGTPVPPDVNLRVKGAGARYVGRGGEKLASALVAFGLDVSGSVVLDAGASTGGFTDCLVQHGARLVYAVDVGHGQLAGRLRSDPRVVVLERTNIADEALTRLSPKPTLGTIDLSYLSLQDAFPLYARVLAAESAVLALVKPLFEVDDPTLRRSGDDPPDSAVADALRRSVAAAERAGFAVRGVCTSGIRGSGGTREFFLYGLRTADGAGVSTDRSALERQIQTAIRASHEMGHG